MGISKDTFDKPLFFTLLALILFGLVMLSSASVYESHQAYIASGIDCAELTVNCNDFYFKRQLRNILIAFPAGLLGLFMPVIFWRRIAPFFFIGSLAFLLILFIPGVATTFGTSRSWVALPLIGSVQPAEFAKLALVFYLARWLERKDREIATLEGGFIPFCLILAFILVPLVFQPDFGSILVTTVTATAIYFAGGASARHVGLGALLAGLGGTLTVLLFDMEYVKNRFAVFLNPAFDPEGIGFQVKQSLIAVGKGGFFGQGLEGATQRFGYLPEVQSDAMYSAIGESFGFIGTIAVAAAFLFIAYRGIRIARLATSRFARLAATGLSALIAGQGFIHIGVNIALLPLTGITLPFMSYGGSSLLTSFLAAGILLNLSVDSTGEGGTIRRTRRRYV